MNGTFRIRGGKTLNGTVRPIPNKNSLLGALPAAMLECEGVTFHDLPDTTDVETFLEIYRRLGAQVTRTKDTTHIDCSGVNSYRVDLELGRKLRGAFMLVGPLLSRFGVAEVPLPGGCKLGARSVSVHINAFRSLGVTVDECDGYLRFTAPEECASHYAVWLLEASVTATANVAMYAVGRGCSVDIADASCEPHVCDVLRLLEQLGGRFEGIGTNRLRVLGAGSLGSGLFHASPDHVDIAGYFVAAAVTSGTLRIEGANLPEIMTGIINWFRLFGLVIEADGTDLVVHGGSGLALQKHEFPLAGRDLPKLSVRPWPGFPVDILPVMVTLACKTQGSILIQNWMYESGFDFVRELNYLGAEIYVSDPQKIIVLEPVVRFTGGEVAAPGIIQGTKAIFLAALADEAETVMHGTDILRRRYPDILTNYCKLGADIEYIGKRHNGNGKVAGPAPVSGLHVVLPRK